MNRPAKALPAQGARQAKQLAKHDEAAVRRLLSKSMATNTMRAYLSSWNAWMKWAEANNYQIFPAYPESIAAWAAAMQGRGMKIASIRRNLAAIGYVHKKRDIASPVDSPIVKSVLSGIAKEIGSVSGQVSGISHKDLRKLRKVAKDDTIAMIMLMRDALLRRSELVRVEWDHFTRGEDGSGVLVIPRSKTDQAGAGVPVYVGSQTMAALEKLPVTGNRVFPISVSTVARRIKQAAEAAGMEGQFSGHSCRVGMAQDLAEDGASVVEMQTAGRWSSPKMPARYASGIELRRGAVARLYNGDKEET
ncbi:MAG: tyrosine-type recombinase/integrase [Pseudomonadales bacterium]